MSSESTPAIIPLSMLVVFVSAKLMAEMFERIKQPGIVGEILAGVLIGPSVLGWMAPNQFLSALSDLGAMFLMFHVGLEVRSAELLKLGGTATVVAVAGVAVPFALGWFIMLVYGAPQNEAIFVGACMVATSVGITAQVLTAKRLLRARASKIILAAAVIDDVLGLLVLAVVSSVTRGKLNPLGLALTGALAFGFTLVVAKWGTRTMDKVAPQLEKLRLAEAQFAVAMSLLFGLSLLAVYTGVAAIVGAFLAGMALAETAARRVHELTQGLTELLVPFFLVGIGLQVDLKAFSAPGTVLLAAAILIAAVISKFLGCGLGAYRLGKLDAIRIGVGMIPRGEVGMAVAQVGLGYGIVKQNVFAVAVFMAVATTLVAPPLLTLAYKGLLKPGEPEEEVMRLG